MSNIFIGNTIMLKNILFLTLTIFSTHYAIATIAISDNNDLISESN